MEQTILDKKKPIELVFICGSGIRRVYVKGRVITYIFPELKFTPMTLDLDKLDSEEYQRKIKESKMKQETIDDAKKFSKFATEEEIIADIKKDFQKSGWRLIKKNDN